MLSKLRNTLAATACLVAATAAVAPMAQASDYWSSDAWYVGDYSDADGPNCGLGTQDFIEGRSPLTTFFFMFRDLILVSFQNDDWSITNGERYSGMKISIFDANDRIAANYEGSDFIGGTHSQMTVFTENDMLDHIARNRTLTTFRTTADNQSVVVAQVDLRGSSEGIAKLRECHQAASARHQAAIEREQHHPKDPFAR